MTDITRIFNVETRGFTNVQRRYSGQIGDATSTVMHFEYNPIDFLAHTEDNEWYVPYIQFAVYDENGNPYTYGPVAGEREDGSVSQVFDGYTFSIPWEITSNVKSQRVEYQLFFIRNTVDVDPTQSLADQLVQTDYIRSAMDGITLKPSIACKKKQKTACAVPGAVAPTIGGFIEFFKEYAYLYPVKQSVDTESGQLILEFKTYNGNKDGSLIMDVAPLVVDDEGNKTIPIKFLRMLDSGILEEVEPEEWNSYFASVADDTKMPTNKLVADLLSMKLDESQLINEWSETPSEEKIPSEALVLDELEGFTKKDMAIPEWNSEMDYHMNSTVMYEANIYISLQDDNMGHEPSTDTDAEDEWWSTVSEYDILLKKWNDRPVTNKAPNEKMVVEALDTKLDDSQLVTEWSTPLDNAHIPSEYLVKSSLDAKLDDSQLVTAWPDDTELSDERIPSEKLVKESLNEKLDKTNPLPEWSVTTLYHDNSVVIYGNVIYISKADSNIGVNPAYDTAHRYWIPVQGGGGGDDPHSKYVDIIGDGENTEFLVHHGLGTLDIFHTLRAISDTYYMSEGLFVDADVTVEDENTIKLSFYEPPAENSLVLVVSTGYQANSYTTTLTSDTPYEYDAENMVYNYTITHNMGVYDFYSVLRRVPSGDGDTSSDIGAIVRANIRAISPVQAVISFTRQVTKPIKVTLSAAIAEQSQEGYTKYFENLTEWYFQHDFGRIVQVQTYDADGNELIGVVSQDLLGGTWAKAQFNDAVTGYMVVKG